MTNAAQLAAASRIAEHAAERKNYEIRFTRYEFSSKSPHPRQTGRMGAVSVRGHLKEQYPHTNRAERRFYERKVAVRGVVGDCAGWLR